MTAFELSAIEIGPFRAIEESTLAQLTPASARNDVFSWYTLIGMIGSALGTVVSGWVIELLESRDGWTTAHAYRIIFFGYGALGIVKLVLSLVLSQACEIDIKSKNLAPRESVSGSPSENSRLLPDNGKKDERRNGWQSASSTSKGSLSILGERSFLMALESLAMGLLLLSLAL